MSRSERLYPNQEPVDKHWAYSPRHTSKKDGERGVRGTERDLVSETNAWDVPFDGRTPALETRHPPTLPMQAQAACLLAVSDTFDLGRVRELC
jgi:hypothetical protein